MGIDFKDKELKKKYSCGPLLKKVNCGGRTIRVEGLDVETAERINRRVSASARQHFVESHACICGDELKFGGQTSGHVKKKSLY